MILLIGWIGRFLQVDSEILPNQGICFSTSEKYLKITVWKFNNVPAIKILREINFAANPKRFILKACVRDIIISAALCCEIGT